MQDLVEKIEESIKNGSFGIAKNLLLKLDDLSLIDEDENTFLSFCVSKGADIEFIRFLISLGFDVYKTNELGVSLLDEAISWGRLDIVKMLIEEYDFEPNSTKRDSGFLPIIAAVSYAREDIVKYLISKGADIEARDPQGLSAKDYAKKLGVEFEYL
jgi:ankyrin repeat protein